MKKLIVIVASLLVAVSAHAQFGIMGGITSSRTDYKEAYTDVKNITQYHVGITYKFALGRMFAIQPAILYNMKGVKLSELKSVDGLDFKTGYIEVPVQLQVGFGLGDVARIYGFAEPFIGYAVSNTVSLSGKNLTQGWEDVKSKLEYGVGLGIGVELIKHVQVSVKYFWNMGEQYGIDLKNYINGAVGTIGSQKASGIAASVALLF
ncbi:MAG: PorT family protein [Bacteroidales bacterium]|nr:PorT family protein [Bacteroidales bacterium]